MAFEGDLGISDAVEAQMIETAPPVVVVSPKPVFTPEPDASPVEQAQTATVEQTGADPPPPVVQHPRDRSLLKGGQ